MATKRAQTKAPKTKVLPQREPQTFDLSSLTNSMFQKVALEARKQGFNLYGKQSKEARALAERIVRNMLECVSGGPEGFSDKRKKFVSQFERSKRAAGAP